jgi:DUF1680 family protein
MTSRRRVLKGIGAVAGGLALRPTAFAEALSVPDEFISGKAGKLVPFPMTQVRLLPGEMLVAAEINQTYLDTLKTDRLLHSFRETSGIASTATPYGGWERPTCELRGHFNGGHYLSAVALAYASSGNDTLRRSGDVMVAGMARCQKANGNGYLGAYPAELFAKLARNEKAWAPFYTLHKIMAGLVDMYAHTGNEDALHTAEGMAGWVEGYFDPIGFEQRQRMFRTEYGGMNEVLLNLYGLTGKQQYLDTARLFEEPGFLDPLAAHRDQLKGLHANTHVPKVIGAARMYELTGETRYRDIASYFLKEVTTERNYAIGNCSQDEHWRNAPGTLAGSLEFRNAECCVAYNLMKLDRHAFAWTGEAKWMDAYERSMWNCRMGTQDAQGRKEYFFPLEAGYWRRYNSAEDSFWCCTGTGAEEFAKFNDTIYFHGPATPGAVADLWVNQFVASELDWKEAKFGLRQDTLFPAEQGTTLRVKVAAPQQRTIRIRIPGWVAGDVVAKVNGKPVGKAAKPGSYLALSQMWHNGDRIEITLTMRLRTEELAGDPTMRAALYGPMVLALPMGPGPMEGTWKIGDYDPFIKVTPPAAEAPVEPAKEIVEVTSSKELTFKSAGGLAVKPMYRIADEKYAVYWRREKKA